MVAIHTLDALEGETVFAFMVVRLARPLARDPLLAVLRFISPMIPDADTVVAELLDQLEGEVRVLAIPWGPPEAGHAVDAQRRLIGAAGSVGIEAAWFFQTGTSLPAVDEPDGGDEDEGDDGEEEDDEDDDDDDEGGTLVDGQVSADSGAGGATRRGGRAMTVDERTESAWGRAEEDATNPVALFDLSGGDEDGDKEAEQSTDDETGERPAAPAAKRDAASEEDSAWSHGPPSRVTQARFPVDGYPGILDELDWEDFGIAFKLRGPMEPGERTVLAAFHSLWLAPYGGRFRNTSVTLDRTHHAAHLWVDRFSVPCSAEDQVHHLLWIVSKIDEVIPVVHARFAGATMAQKYGGLLGDTDEPFVLGGNPLVALHSVGGEAAVDAWIATQADWSSEEIARMLRELAIEIVTGGDAAGDAAEDLTAEVAEGGADARAAQDDDDALGPDAEEAAQESADRGRLIATYAGEVLRARASAGLLDPRTAEELLPLLATTAKFEHRRRAVVEILGALRYRPAVPAMIRILEETPIKGSLDAIGKEDFVAATAGALGAIADPAAIASLARVAAAPGAHNDKPRPVAADALAACLAETPEPRSVDDAVLVELLATIRERNDAELNAETHFAYGRLVRQLPPDRRAEARRRLAESDTARDDAVAMLARQAALLLASPTSPVDAPPRDLQPLLHEALTALDYDHDYTVRNLRVALRVAEVVPELADPADLVWLTRFSEGDIRNRAHGLLATLGLPMPPARVLDRGAVRALADDELVELVSEAHLVGRAAVIVEIGRRGLTRAKRAIIDVCHDVISRARPGGENLLDPDTRVLEAAAPILRAEPREPDVIALLDRMLRHSNYHVKWELLQAAPPDERLIPGMFHVLGERWGWQEQAARTWLAAFQGTPAYEAERRRAPRIEDRDHSDDEDMN